MNRAAFRRAVTQIGAQQQHRLPIVPIAPRGTMRVSAAHLLDCAVEVRVHRAQPHRALQRPTERASSAAQRSMRFSCAPLVVCWSRRPRHWAATGTRVLSGAHVRAPGTQQHPAAPGRHWRTWSGSMLPWVAASCSAFTDEISRSFRSSSCIVRAWAGMRPCERARARVGSLRALLGSCLKVGALTLRCDLPMLAMNGFKT